MARRIYMLSLVPPNTRVQRTRRRTLVRRSVTAPAICLNRPRLSLRSSEAASEGLEIAIPGLSRLGNTSERKGKVSEKRLAFFQPRTGLKQTCVPAHTSPPHAERKLTPKRF